jgi:hypothetical protein
MDTDSTFDIRFARPDDAQALVGLLTRQHGLLHPQQALYDAAFVADAIATKRLVFAVAATEDGELAAMICAETPPQGGTTVFSLLTVVPAHRQRRLGERVQDFLYENLPLAQSAYACMYCLTMDLICQRVAERRGYTPTGLLPNRYFFDRSAVNLQGKDPPLKRSHLLLCKAFAQRDAGLLYCPAEAADFVAAVYGALGVDFTRANADADDEPARASFARPSAFHARQNEQHAYCEIQIDGAGDDLAALLSDCARSYDDIPFQTYSVTLNMAHASCPFAYEVLKDRGYACTGLSPLAESGAYLLFSRSPSLPPNYDHLALLPSFRAMMERLR